ncbi:MAG: alpha/beta fold hydrolase [Ferrovibrio sp.]|uniref:alpha/beta fold hydrolase n=1 Tax=Ferrovibrio sp. TaxID=1917215 RepID=UPI003918F6CC
MSIRQPILTRRHFLAGSAALGLSTALPGCATRYDQAAPIVFVHGNGDTAALWHTTFWRWESNGFDTDRLFAIDFPYPLARSVDATYQAYRSSSTDQREQLAAFVAEAKRRTGAPKVVLVGSSRGGNAIRNYIKNGGGAAHVSHAILCGTPNHGVLVSDKALVGSEFNGASPFLRQLNDGPTEVVPGLAWMTTRSDNADKFAQPDGAALGMPGQPTGVTAEGPALKGAKDVVLAGLDHREVAFHPKAFAAIWEFVMGSAPATTGISAESSPLLNGKVNDIVRGAGTNMPVAGAVVEVYETDPKTGARRVMVHKQTTGEDGYWGPFRASSRATYEFVVITPDHPTTHIYRSPFARSSQILHLRPGVLTDKDKAAASSVTISRPRGYFGAARGDIVTFDGQPGPGIPPGIPVNSTSTLLLPAGTAQRSVVCRFNDEVIAVQSWPVADNRVVIAELHY